MKSQIKKSLTTATAVVAAAAMSFSLAACGEGESDNAEGDVTIGISFWGSDSRVRITQQVIDGFEKENPHIHVEEQYSDWSGYWDKLATQIAGGEAPDVLSIDEMYLASYASQGTLANLSDYADTIDVSQFDQSLVDMGKIDGIWYGIANSLQAYAVTVNKDLLDRYGLTLPDTSTWTWDEFKDFAKQVYVKSNGEIVGAFPSYNGYGLQLWARQHGENLYEGNKVAISADTLAEYLNMPAEWAQEGLYDFNAWSENITATSDMSLFNTGKQAMNISTLLGMNVLSQKLGTKNLSLELIPNDSSKKVSYYKPGNYWTINAKSKHPKEAAMLINYMLNNKDGAKIMGLERGIPSPNDVRQYMAENTESIDKLNYEFIDTYKETVGGEAPEVTPNGASSIDSLIMRYMQDIGFNKTTPDKAATDFIAELQKSIDEA